MIGKNLLESLPKFLETSGVSSKNVLIVSQKPIANLYLNRLQNILIKNKYTVSEFVSTASKSSETLKTETSFLKLIRKIASADGKNKTPFLIALGGGVVGDLTGFAAGVYRRGISYVQVPTTLTAQVDSAIGGKTGVDLPEGKNLLGVIHQPKLVLSDLDLLQSLPERHWSDGFAEVIKYGVISDPNLFRLLEQKGLRGLRENTKLLEEVVFSSARIKAKIVEKDEYDKKDIRIVLNFGHTAGHAIESVSGYSGRYTHGEAVAIGMLVACEIAMKMGYLASDELRMRLESTLIKFNLPIYYKNLPIEKLLESIGFDKKSHLGKNRFVLPLSLSKTIIVKDIPENIIAEALKARSR